LRFADSKSDYRCLRLPPSGVPGAAPSGAQGVPPTGDPIAPRSVEADAPPPATQGEGDAVKKE
jgi:hypothetical protein